MCIRDSFIAMMFMAHMQKAGHRPIALLGGGTAMVGDPSGKTDMRSMLTKEQIEHNVSCIKKQMEKFIDFSDDKAILVNNADWLLNLNYVDFLREVGVHLSLIHIYINGYMEYIFNKYKEKDLDIFDIKRLAEMYFPKEDIEDQMCIRDR